MIFDNIFLSPRRFRPPYSWTKALYFFFCFVFFLFFSFHGIHCWGYPTPSSLTLCGLALVMEPWTSPGGRVSLRGGGSCSARLALSDSQRPWNLGEDLDCFRWTRGRSFVTRFQPIALLHFVIIALCPLLFIFLEDREMIKEIDWRVRDRFCLRVLPVMSFISWRILGVILIHWLSSLPILPHLWPFSQQGISLTSSLS